MSLRKWTVALAGGMLAVTGCDNDAGTGTPTELPPLAYYRYVNAVPDTNALDVRFTDTIEFSQPHIGVRFRQFTPYQGTLPGARPMKVFLNPFAFPQDNSIAIASTVVEEATVTLEAGRYYTILHVGGARGDNDQLLVIQDDFPTLAAGQIGLRAIHAVSSTLAGNVNVLINQETAASAFATPATATVANVAPFTASNYAAVAARPTTPTTSSYQFGVVLASDGTTQVASALIGGVLRDGLIGQPATIPAVAAVKNAGSVLSAVVMPPSVAPPAGVPATDRPQFAAPGIVVMPDRNP